MWCHDAAKSTMHRLYAAVEKHAGLRCSHLHTHKVNVPAQLMVLSAEVCQLLLAALIVLGTTTLGHTVELILQATSRQCSLIMPKPKV